MKSREEIRNGMPEVGEEQIALLERLSNASGVTGGEGEVRKIVLEEVEGQADSVEVDALGNVIVEKRGAGERLKRVMLSAHMDEIGLMITVDEGDGMYQFERVGGIDVRQLPGKVVEIGKEHVLGVIGARAIHLTTREQREVAIGPEMLRIDTGMGSTSEKVKIGDRVTFATKFWQNGTSVFGKALDDRLGVVTLIELLKNPPENVDLYLVFSTQEEIGLRGARVAAYRINPDIAIAIDSTPANDYPMMDEAENTTYNTKLGKGPAIYVMDRATISNPQLVKYIMGIAQEYEIPYQIRQAGGGGTDAGAMHVQREGIPSISISVPGRNPHTAIGIARRKDWENLMKLVYASLSSMTEELRL
ncbi:MAG: M20/M25/M40 family metallo-hydrolase [Anaerolineaceae bacterium]|nr:M20/M25/M40 family metallo-hydrolase [Anaerolineaceae bacterium]